VRKSTSYVTCMSGCDNVLMLDGSVELKVKMDGRRSGRNVESIGG